MASQLRKELGTFSTFPPEIRDKIWAQVLNLNPPNDKSPRVGLLSASKRIYEESKKILYIINDFFIFIERSHDPLNMSVTNYNGFEIKIAYCNKEPGILQSAEFTPSMDTLQLIKHWIIAIKRVYLYDLSPNTDHSFEDVSGPQREEFKPLITALKESFGILSHCQQIHQLVFIMAAQPGAKPESHVIWDQLMTLRGIRKASIDVVFRTRKAIHDGRYNFTLKADYCNYMARVMALPAGEDKPPYIRKAVDGDGATEGIYKYVNDCEFDRRPI